ncbi:MAG: ATP-binding protein [Prevotella sp.]|nr:ATP-binding protein [Prevotella sp.]
MIEEITFKNVLSFKNETTLSFEATSDKTFESYHVVTMPNGTRLLKLGIVYGANAGGKSNLLSAISLLRNFMVIDPQNMDEPTGFEPFLLDKETPNLPSEYSIKFWVNGIRYWYQLITTTKLVLQEKLSYYKTVQPIKIFERAFEDGQSVLSFNPAVQRLGQNEHKAISLNCLPNKSFFAARGRVNMKIQHVDAVRQWIHNNFMPMVSPITNMEKYSKKMIKEDISFKEHLLRFLHQADFNITGLNEKTEVPNEQVLGFEHTVENKHGLEKYEFSTHQESAGTTRVIDIEATIYEAIKNNSFLMIDEIDSSLHPNLIEFIIQEYITNSSESQMLITTHYPGLLNTIDDLIRKDNIWFVEKDKSGATDLYSLVEFKGLNKISKIERAYRIGKFGALPNI